MYKTLKRLVIIDLALLVITVFFVALTWNRDDFSGIIAFYPLTAMIFITIAIVVIGFLIALRQATSSKNTSATQLIWTTPLLLGVPALGLFYATHGQNRGGLVLVSIVALVVGSLALLALIIKQGKRLS